jgi:hypothetical protein
MRCQPIWAISLNLGCETNFHHGLELIYKVNLKSSVFFAYQGFQAPETVLSGFPESLVLREFQRLNKSALMSMERA